jgi:hypothetical protein
MSQQVPEVETARLRVVACARCVIDGVALDNLSIELAARELTCLMRAAGEPPEKVLLALKRAAYDAGAGPTVNDQTGIERRLTSDLVNKLVRWCVDAYFSKNESESSMPSPSKEKISAKRR